MKKNSMELSITKPNFPSVNETPTPTRFIRYCEAVDLFHDLNPFEETFKKAVENVKKGCTKTQNPTYLSKSAGDELHTPQVFLETPESQQVETELVLENVICENSTVNLENLEEAIIRSEADTSICNDPSQRSSLISTVNNINPTNESVHVLFEMPNGTILQLSVKPVKMDVEKNCEAVKIAPKKILNDHVVHPHGHTLLQKKHPPSNPRVKEKLKAFLNDSLKSKVGKTTLTSNSNDISIIKQQPRPVNVLDDTQSKTLGSSSIETEKDKKKKILERNRKAASRCRERRKRHVESLINTNKMLNLEVARLRAEVLRLQTVVMAQANYTLTEIAPCSSVSSTVEGNEQLIIETPVKMSETSLEVASFVEMGVLSLKRKDKLTLDIAKATENSDMMDLDSPSIIRCDEVLSSVAHPTTPDERYPFAELVHQRDMGDSLDKQLNTPTTVIQLNPNVLKSGI